MNKILSYGNHDALSYGNKLIQSCMIFIWVHHQHIDHIFAQNKPEPMPLRCLKRENSLILRLIDILEATSTWY